MILTKQARDLFTAERKAQQIPQHQLARMTGTTQATISCIETGRSILQHTLANAAAHLALELQPLGSTATLRYTGNYITPRQASLATGSHADSIIRLAESGYLQGVSRCHDGRWLLPSAYQDNLVQPVILDHLLGLGNQYTSGNHLSGTPWSMPIALFEGPAVLHLETQNTSLATLTIERQDRLGWTTITSQQFPPGTEENIFTIPCSPDPAAITKPGQHRLSLSSDGPWTLTWLQPQPHSGWFTFSISIQPFPKGLAIIGPTLPVQTPVDAKITVDEPNHLSIEAFAADGSHLTTIFDDTANPGRNLYPHRPPPRQGIHLPRQRPRHLAHGMETSNRNRSLTHKPRQRKPFIMPELPVQAMTTATPSQLDTARKQLGLNFDLCYTADNGVTIFEEAGPSILQELIRRLGPNTPVNPLWDQLDHHTRQALLQLAAESPKWDTQGVLDDYRVEEFLQEHPHLAEPQQS